ncbi:MAG: polymer-forming cytoskeletal protein [Leptospiraceae bacterium]|nr:polymer-forming cytoskeletal protein [Leptospiraceae bacterium]MCB1314911.1 polymer-forming cytoskeletal protein [Leptospiraceae bacterium]MCB1320323.1 polymer-forming cytoskeletal protein [Leptospiraceae bacterium]
MADSTENLIVNSLIGEGSEFRGEFKVKDLIRIDGYFKGNIITDGKVLVGQSGVVETDIRAGVVVVGGEVRGSIHATRRVILLSSCRLFGDIATRSLLVEEGVIFEGRCTINR